MLAGRRLEQVRRAGADALGLRPHGHSQVRQRQRRASGRPSSSSSSTRASGGRLRAEPVRYDTDAPDVDQVIVRDLLDGRIDVADVAARAWESVGVTGLRAFQSPFLLTSDALLDRATGDRRVTRPLLRSMESVKVTGLAVVPGGVRYVFATRALATPQAFAGARIRVNASLTTDYLLRSLGARPTTAVRHGRDVVEALESGRLDAVEADIAHCGQQRLHRRRAVHQLADLRQGHDPGRQLRAPARARAGGRRLDPPGRGAYRRCSARRRRQHQLGGRLRRRPQARPVHARPA